jgi:hypothetical protein
MRVRARNQRQIDTGYVDKQGHGDTEDANPKAPIAVRTFPVGTMRMRFMMVTVLDFSHSYPVFLVHFVARKSVGRLGNSTKVAQYGLISAIKLCHCANYHRWSSLLTRGPTIRPPRK